MSVNLYELLDQAIDGPQHSRVNFKLLKKLLFYLINSQVEPNDGSLEGLPAIYMDSDQHSSLFLDSTLIKDKIQIPVYQ